MPEARVKGSVGEAELGAWLRRNPDAPGAEVARARLEYMVLEGEGRFLRGLLGQTRVRSRVLITAQVSGRWSTTNPNLPGRSRKIKKGHDIVVPDWGTFWLAFDLSTVEARLAAVYAGEYKDLDVMSPTYCVECRHDHTRRSGELRWTVPP